MVFVGMSPRQMMGRGQVQLMNHDGIDSHVPPLLSSPPSRRHQRMPRRPIASAGTILTSPTNGFFVDPVAALNYDTVTKKIFYVASSRRHKTDIQDVEANESARV